MNKCSSLTDQQRHNIRDAIKNSVTLAEITQETNVTKVIEYLLEDRSKLERYLSAMAAVLTRQRR
jgi:predicted DNA-binding protein YlxM (UPF0122 family)